MTSQEFSKRFMMASRLRTVVAVFFFILFVLFMALWVRSYRVKDILWVRYGGDDAVRVSSTEGIIISSIKHWGFRRRSPYLMHSRIGRGPVYTDDFGKKPSRWWFQVLRWKSGLTEIHVPLWFPVLLTGALSILVSKRWRYSLRTLLFIMTFSALVLGVAVTWHTP